MEPQEPKAPNQNHHPEAEFNNLWISQSLVKQWTSHPEWNSYDVFPCLYKALRTRERFTPGKPNSPKLRDVLRSSDAFLTGCPEDLLVQPPNLYLSTARFSDRLDEILRQTPKTAEQTIHDAAFSYYVFERIHPFDDGNGRIGRMILKRIFKGGYLRDPIFHDQRWYGGGRSDHLDTQDSVHHTNNLAHLELFLANALIRMYDPVKDREKFREIAKVIQKKKHESRHNADGRLLSDIWKGFANIPVYGNITPGSPK